LDLAHFARQASREFWHFFLDSPNFRHILGLLSRNMVIEVGGKGGDRADLMAAIAKKTADSDDAGDES
jgi:hypothetical protein